MSNSDDDIPALSAETFMALQEFYKEQEIKESKLKLAVASNDIKEIHIEEDWQLSQFWYDQETVDFLANLAVKSVGPTGKIALVSCPSLYKKTKELSGPEQEVILFEYDKRFAVYGSDFHYFDYNYPLEVGENMGKHFDLVVVDPPFLAEECLNKNYVAMKYLSKDKIILCTGAKMSKLAESMGLVKTEFVPKHKNNLGNEFCCYSNYDFSTINTQSYKGIIYFLG
ncbi:EEF1A lysine methyltransferase 1 isoform X2 [Aethina tumida]|nr:EEF1A lysine methyltransferase 1 isoform X2 [Aethina tumida]